MGVLLQATDRLREMVHNAEDSNDADIAGIMAALNIILNEHRAASNQGRARPDAEPQRSGDRLRMLLAEDDLAGRLVLQVVPFPLRRVSRGGEWALSPQRSEDHHDHGGG